MVDILEASFEDLSVILELQKLCYRENARRYNNERIKPLLQTLPEVEEEFRDCVFLKATVGSIIIGSVRARRMGRTCFIIRLFVHPDYHNRGIGTSLMKSIEIRFPDVDRYELFTGYRDEKNLYLYRKLGYKKFKEERQSDGMIFYYMEKLRE